MSVHSSDVVGCRPEEVVLDASLQSSERILDEKGLEELDKILGIVHGEPFTEKRSEILELLM
jgi:predicted Zn-dependent protease with MMP-like domain